MWLFLLLMCFLSVSPGHDMFDGHCPRKDPPPGMVVVTPGSKLVLTCSGHVKVDGVKVHLTKSSPNTNKNGSSLAVTPTTQTFTGSSAFSIQRDQNSLKNTTDEGYHSQSTEAVVSTTPGEIRSLGYTDAVYTAAPHIVQPTSASRPLKGESDWEAEEMDDESDYEGDEEEGSRVTRGTKSKPQWKWTKRVLGRGDRDWGEISFGRSGATLSVASVRLTDSGKYICHNRGREKFSVKVIVEDPPENPTLFCYKKSPSSKIRCEWVSQKPIIKQPQCYLLLSKSSTLHPNFRRLPCSYSSQHSRCWCALDYDDDEQRILHMAYLCVTSVIGNATSDLVHFTPLGILKPDPPSNVSVRQEEGHHTRIKVTWNLPISWKQQDSHYALIYELKYRPLKSSFDYEQKKIIDSRRYYTITDAMPGVEYVIQLRAKDEYDGQWSEWAAPVFARSWTVAVTSTEDLTTSVFDLGDLIEGSGSGSDDDPNDTMPEPLEWSHPALWIIGLFALLSAILAVYIFRHKDRFMSKLHNLGVISQCGDLSPPPPSVPIATEEQALMTFAPLQYKDGPPNSTELEEEQSEEERSAQDQIEAMHFNNTSYFFLQRE